MSQIEPFNGELSRGFLHRPVESNHAGLVLTHGAGGNCEAPLMMAIASAFANAGFHVLRFDLPFRVRRRFGPPHPSWAEEDRAGLRATVASMRSMVSGSVILGGHSYGARQASMLAAQDGSICDALLLLSYPLHPPKKPEQLRTAHLAQLKVPSLFVHGIKDPFGTTEEMRLALEFMPAARELSVIEKAGHELAGGKFEIRSLVIEPVKKLL